MRVLITGGFGYLGGRVAQVLAVHGGCEVLLGSRTQVGSPTWLPQATAIYTPWESGQGLQDICAGVDTIVHLAGMNERECSADPVAALAFNALGTARLLHAAMKQGVRRMIYVSTAHVYCSPLIGVVSEETCPVSLHPYASSHRAAEDVLCGAHQRDEIEAIVVRLSNAFGAPAHKDANCWMLVINDLCRQAVTTKRMILRSSGLQRRDFIPVSDVGHAILHLLHLPRQAVGIGIFNLGGNWSPTIWDAASLVRDLCKETLGFDAELTCIPPSKDEISGDLTYCIDSLLHTGFRLVSDRCQEIRQLLRFTHSSLQSGLKVVVE